MPAGILHACEPRDEVLRGELNDALFAAEFGDLLTGAAPPVYQDAPTFFENTHPATALRKITETVFERLADPREPGLALRLSTGFGGGKTHTLMALWHLARNVGDVTLGTDLLPAAGRPGHVHVAAVDAGKAGTRVFTTRDGREIRSLWGALAYDLQKEAGLEILGDLDTPSEVPDDGLIRRLLPEGPVLILLDELVVYMAALGETEQDRLLGFLQKLLAVATSRPQTVVIVTDPAKQTAYAQHAAAIQQATAAAIRQAATAAKLDDVYGRKGSDFDPIGGEAAQMIVRRLFKRVDRRAAELASAAYHALYERVSLESPALLPQGVATKDYGQRIAQSYPFHPRLIDTAQERLGALQEFHKSRGTLRLFARIIKTVWEAGENLDLISAGEVDWNRAEIRQDLLHRLNRDNFRAAADADAVKHAGDLDGGAGRGIHTRAAAALLLESIPMQANSGFSRADLTLAVLRPDEAGPEPTEAAERLGGVCWHTYPLPAGNGWQFRYEPNVIKLIEERMADVSLEDARQRVLSEVQGYFSGMAFKLVPWPRNAAQVPGATSDLQLALCETEALAKAACEYEDDRDPAAPIPRRFRNAVVALTASQAALESAVEKARRLRAAELVEAENKGEHGRLLLEQLRPVKPEYIKQFRLSARRAFDRVVTSSGSYAMEEAYWGPDEVLIAQNNGQANLMRYLEDKGLIYRAGAALDPDRLHQVLAGAVPAPGFADATTGRAAHERLLAAPNLRLLRDGGFVRSSILKALSAGKLAVRFPDGRAFDAEGVVEGVPGHRRRVENAPLPGLPLDDTVLVASVGSEAATMWLQVDSEAVSTDGEVHEDDGVPLPPPPPPGGALTLDTWAEIAETSAVRPLQTLHLKATTPAVAQKLAALAQPLGADRLAFNIYVAGESKDGGGRFSFSADGVRLNHPAKPLALAQTLYNAAQAPSFEAELHLAFEGEGRTGLDSALHALSEAATDVQPQARFGAPAEVNA